MTFRWLRCELASLETTSTTHVTFRWLRCELASLETTSTTEVTFASPSLRGRERSEANLTWESASGSYLALTVAALPGDHRVAQRGEPHLRVRLGLVPRPHGRCAPWRPRGCAARRTSPCRIR
ncbi:hypothetical protein HMPREF0063_10802 [Aeromicrobium marinum DSM 15272]|uniref:Uncharacterized protein n=1 Tax=Aeromicrobium marinum DSM 15272 TaxID=585531 RepID=E2SA12_9ACTN|nr:hypothetical protein HMPREF0063_10802 [Aeromicrobium marinum DSM 15272]